MSKSTFIYVDKEENLTLEQVRDYLHYYQDITTKTGEQLDWNYQQHAFPYVMSVQKDNKGHYIWLKGMQDRYHHILIGIGKRDDKQFVQITLPIDATHGDKAKANEFAKFLTKKLNGKLQLFNGRVMN
ncbi:hypothetical protein HNQ94_003463 [Salirhabdus euzebyi]|uniref:DUF1885 family protein n=1 Tax=Salirhabdus euzebyi TaxID=394506 RepID=A0A841Q8M0_9BACI|nr:DUF1885 family protein [Salirhabdus euzebyi]MBB6454969.1 hypothetical protein [Salirhabdus euzebyi]